MNYTDISQTCSDMGNGLLEEWRGVPDEVQRAMVGSLMLAAAAMLFLWVMFADAEDDLHTQPIARPRLRAPTRQTTGIRSREDVIKALQSNPERYKVIQGRCVRRNHTQFGKRYELFNKAPFLSKVLSYDPSSRRVRLLEAFSVPVVRNNRNATICKESPYTATDFLYDLKMNYVQIITCQ